ncbi:organic cation transporter protein-like [Microplitis demolitor]|uniref:organic cation transporter protein-like n=1 Tax=Microplitis demolitor TaxID=69319 RepID=UPI0004CCE500|nr:organic cation transporter protein-like [Microplitis demolitor]XP_053597211.1 organic cation transporter protein-like [Microplitis demolitor]
MVTQEDNEIQEKFILQALDELGQSSQLLWIVLFASILVSLINGLNTMSYIFIAEVPNYWCAIPELTNANWTDEQIKNISIINGCQKYDYNYTYLASLEYEEATDYVKDSEFNTSVVSCSSFVFDKSGRSTIVNEWQLVCDRKVHRANTFLAYAFGKLVGGGILGIAADKYGRKKSLIISLVLQTVAMPLSALVPWFWAYIVFKFLVGASVSSLYSTAYTMLSEIATSHRKKVFGAIIDSMFQIGTLVLISIAYFSSDWRHLQLTLSLFTLLLVIIIWFVPESPRWLISQNRHSEAKKLIKKYYKTINQLSVTTEDPMRTFLPLEKPVLKNNPKKGLKRYFGNSSILFSDPILRINIIIMYYTFFATFSVSYYLILNIDIFETNRYIYSTIGAIIELIALTSVPAILIFFSCQKANALLHIILSISMLTIGTVSKKYVYVAMVMTMISKFLVTVCYTTIALFCLELFPPGVRNSAFGTSLVMGQIGSMTAPYIVDLLGQVARWVPPALCATLSFATGLFILIISKNELNNKNNIKIKEEIPLKNNRT